MDRPNLRHSSRALAFRASDFIFNLNLAAVLFVGLQGSSHCPEDGFRIVRVLPARPQLQNMLLLSIEVLEGANQALLRILQIAMEEGHRVHMGAMIWGCVEEYAANAPVGCSKEHSAIAAADGESLFTAEPGAGASSRLALHPGELVESAA